MERFSFEQALRELQVEGDELKHLVSGEWFYLFEVTDPALLESGASGEDDLVGLDLRLPGGERRTLFVPRQLDSHGHPPTRLRHVLAGDRLRVRAATGEVEPGTTIDNLLARLETEGPIELTIEEGTLAYERRPPDDPYSLRGRGEAFAGLAADGRLVPGTRVVVLPALEAFRDDDTMTFRRADIERLRSERMSEPTTVIQSSRKVPALERAESSPTWTQEPTVPDEGRSTGTTVDWQGEETVPDRESSSGGPGPEDLSPLDIDVLDEYDDESGQYRPVGELERIFADEEEGPGKESTATSAGPGESVPLIDFYEGPEAPSGETLEGLVPVSRAAAVPPRATVRSHSRMNPLANFRLEVDIEGPAGPAVEILPCFPGCLVVPPSLVVDARQAEARFWVTPLVAGRLVGAEIVLRRGRTVLRRIPVPCRVSTRNPARALVALAVAGPVVPLAAEAVGWAGLAGLLEAVGGGAVAAAALAGTCLLAALVSHRLTAPRPGPTIEA